MSELKKHSGRCNTILKYLHVGIMYTNNIKQLYLEGTVNSDYFQHHLHSGGYYSPHKIAVFLGLKSSY